MYPPLESRADLLKMLDEVTRARQQVLERCGRLTPEQRLDPVYPGTWPVLKILAHLAHVEETILAWVRRRPGEPAAEDVPPEAPPELDAVEVALDEAHAGAIAFLKANPAVVLTEPCRYGARAGETVGGLFFRLVEHEVHHRAFLLHKLARLDPGAGRDLV